jgi:hypothetical protein
VIMVQCGWLPDHAGSLGGQLGAVL